MTTTTQLGIEHGEANEVAGYLTFNDAANLLDHFAAGGPIKDRDLTAGPGAPVNGDAYLILAAGSGTWAGHGGSFPEHAYYFNGWTFRPLFEGIRFWIMDEDAHIVTTSASTFRCLSGFQTLTDAATIAWDSGKGNNATVTLGGNRTLGNPTNLYAGVANSIIVKQDATGGRTLAYGSNYRWAGGTPPVVSAGSNAITVLTFITDGTLMYGTVAGLAFA